MKKHYLAVLLVGIILLTGCSESPTKPDLSNIESRLTTLEDQGYTDIYTRRGILLDVNKVNLTNPTLSYWEIVVFMPDSSNNDSCIVQAWVRPDSISLWMEPTWHLYDNQNVCIIDDYIPGYNMWDYKVVVAYKTKE